jgi:23S rRNA pseudouridine1911/1915/1917 synthase
MDLEVIFEDKALIGINKPSGLACEPGRAGEEDCVQSRVLTHYRESGQKAKNLIAGLCHRLDKPASGILILSKKPSVLKVMNEYFEKGQVKKEYLALVEGAAQHIPSSPRLWHKKIDKHFRAEIRNEPGSGFKEIRAGLECLQASPEYSLVKVKLYTGRYHQIRATLAFLGHPVWNDEHYGASKRVEEMRIGLHSSRLEFKHPISSEPVILESPWAGFEFWGLKPLV